MPESYVGNEGTAAAADGMTVLDGTEDRRTGWLAINKARDYIVSKCAAALTAAKAYTDQKVAAISLTWNAISGKPSSFPPSAHTHTSLDAGGGMRFGETSGQWATSQTIYTGANVSVGGHVIVPNATPATSGYAVAYINGDGRLAKNASSERYKKYISALDPASLGDIWPTLSRYQMRHGDGSWKFGYIAERLAEHPDQEPFVVYAYETDADGKTVVTDQPDSIDFIALLMAQNAQLHQAVDLLAQRLDALEER
ncbi:MULTISPECIES: hypothetical protein [unclassified Microbacterium]|uniref:hypothetical protein n=1 Tax=unclassified Microbacterium TaxID=2609290 RepID=UPI000CFC96A9|nr:MULTISPECIES: hypothetical protein [unclassified Microbacterium]PQZ60688.1 hypothetical protein CQ032_04070 [Microbacterium sp. MYb43]PQZ82114.1 hypothetical protein CQ031_01470 [Microbacterium sp. MYb40]PRB22956.1 hypothetical protein CQ037_18135 [Microbacterium sp. MYb50]PRB24186.1 hypothetical protein CQ040_02760 [Microbacterium sp. MYb54]PRB69670.1 hypothetical protein CQ021_02765 [Microbacterium sp. MYb24]